MKLLLIIFLILILPVSCVLSISPITNDPEEIVFKKELPGHWKLIKEEDKVSGSYASDISYIADTCSGSGGRQYRIKYIITDTDEGTVDTSYLLATLIKLDAGYFIDCSPDTSRPAYKNLDNAAQGMFISSHSISLLKFRDENTISVFHADTDKLEELIDLNKLSINYVFLNKNLLLTENTATLKKKLNEPGKLITAFTREETLKKQKE